MVNKINTRNRQVVPKEKDNLDPEAFSNRSLVEVASTILRETVWNLRHSPVVARYRIFLVLRIKFNINFNFKGRNSMIKITKQTK